MFTHVNILTCEIIGAAIEVHRHLGPGLLESVLQTMPDAGIAFTWNSVKSEFPLPLEYKGIQLESGYRLDLLVGDAVVVETKSVESLCKIHEAQLITYLRLGGWTVGLLINFNVDILKNGIRRRVLGLVE
jgi:GxxExxY protein